MWCVTGCESTVTAVQARLDELSDAPMHEIRVDALSAPEPRAMETRAQLVLTCRPTRQGGRYDGSEEERLRLLEAWVETARPAWVDVELDTDAEWRRAAITAAQDRGCRVVVSHHLWQSDADPCRWQTKLDAERTAATKLAVAVDDACELEGLHRLTTAGGRARVVLAMGAAGLLSRAVYPWFGSTWSYAAASAALATAPAQLTWQTVRQWRLPRPSGTPLFVLLGGPQIASSPGPRTYNAWFESVGVDGLYLPVVTDKPETVIPWLRDLGLAGASVTMPLKRRVLELADERTGAADAIGAANTLSFRDGRVLADNTDGFGAANAITAVAGRLDGRRCLVLGTGGTGAAVAWALKQRGGRVTVLGRSPDRSRERQSFDVLANTTPVGADDPRATLVHDASRLTGTVVLDAVLGPRTRLLRDAERVGAATVDGLQMWKEQGRLQLELWLGRAVAVDELRT